MLVKQSHKTLLLWVLLIMMFLAIWQFLSPERTQTTMAPFSDFMTQVHADKDKEPHVESVTIKDREYSYFVKDPKNGTLAKKITIGPENGGDLTKTLDDNKVKVTFEKEEGSPFWSGAVVTILPMVFLLVMFYLFMRQLQAGGGKAMSFGKSRAPAQRGAEQGDVRRRGRHRRGQGRARRDHRLPQGPEEVPEARRPHPQGRADDGPPAPGRRSRARHRR